MADELKAPTRDVLIGAVADALLAARQHGGALGGELLGRLPDYVNNASYGDARLWRGGLMTGQPAPGAFDVLTLTPAGAISKDVQVARMLLQRGMR